MKKKKLSVAALQDFHRACTQWAPKSLEDKPEETSGTMTNKEGGISHGAFSGT
ncbi:MAG: hypothetical protein JRI47_00830 [Deltaproteobacteria bacterium]|nr:hypothetical protein [Deltaproteobacteria bacterium]